VILPFFSDETGAAVKEDQNQGHQPIAYGRGEYYRRPRSKMPMGDEKQKGQGLCGYYNLNEVIVALHFHDNSKIKKSQTEKEQPRLPDKEKILYFCREKEPVEQLRKKENENPQEQTVQPYKQDEYREMLNFFGCGRYFFKDTSYQPEYHYALPPEGISNIF
jgi:hypothetical protein